MNNIIPSISVIMSVFSEPEEWLRESIDSILNQTFSNFEFIIINDNPTCQLNKCLLNEYKHKDKRIIIINNDNNIGLTKSLNIGLHYAKGKYIARMDADDIAFPNRFKMQYSFMEANKNVIVCGTQISYFGKVNQRKADWLKINDEDLKNRLFIGSCIAHPSAFIRKSILDSTQTIYDTTFLQAQDNKLWSDIADYGEFYNIPEVLLKYRISEAQISVKQTDQQKKFAYLVRKQNIEKFIQSLPINVNYSYPEEVTYKDILELVELENLVFKNKKLVTPHLKKKFATLLLSYIIFIEEINFAQIVSLYFSKSIFRKGSGFIELLRLVKRKYFKF
jgi:glycosyltransferase involved in cell wall biosynthesis